MRDVWLTIFLSEKEQQLYVASARDKNDIDIMVNDIDIKVHE